MADWNETKSILLELEQLFKRDDDVRDIEDVKKMAAEIEFQRTQHAKDLKAIIKQYTAKVVAKEHEVLAPSEAVHSSTRDKLFIDKENLAVSINKNLQVKAAKIQDISKIAQQTLALQEQMNDFEFSENMTESRTSYALSLYSKISNISWDYATTTGTNGLVAGCFGNEANKEFQNFEFNTDSIDSFEIANNLWSMIGDGIKD